MNPKRPPAEVPRPALIRMAPLLVSAATSSTAWCDRLPHGQTVLRPRTAPLLQSRQVTRQLRLF